MYIYIYNKNLYKYILKIKVLYDYCNEKKILFKFKLILCALAIVLKSAFVFIIYS